MIPLRRLPRNRVLVGDAAGQLARLPAGSVDCVVTSPPYFALRNYGVEHQLGLETSVYEWVDGLVKVAEEVGRVLKPAGTLWLNLGDSYSRGNIHGAAPKGLVLAPERLLLALAQRGWLVRNKVVWAKPNPMPASVGDRLTCSWEPIFLLTRSRRYHFDLDAIRVPHSSGRAAAKRPVAPRRKPAAWAGPRAGTQSGLNRLHAAGLSGHPLGKNPGDVWRVPQDRHRGHHASFPEALVEAPIKAGCPERVCARCGLAWERRRVAKTVGLLAVTGALRPNCVCRAEYRKGIVLDPFMGSGTVGAVATRLGRDWLGIELNPGFAAAALRRIKVVRSSGPGSSQAA